MRTCIIIEDQPPAQRILQKFIADIGTLELVGTFSNAIEALAFLQSNSVDLIFLDIHLPKISGMDFLKTLKNPPAVILTTAFSEYALESYEYNVVDYLLKPFSFQRFLQAVNKSAPEPSVAALQSERIAAPKEKSTVFFIKSGYDLVKVNPEEILYLKSDADYTEIVMATKKHLSSESLKHWKESLGESFCQVHKSYIVNTAQIQKVSSSQIYLEDKTAIPIGRVYKESFVKSFLRSWVNRCKNWL